MDPIAVCGSPEEVRMEPSLMNRQQERYPSWAASSRCDLGEQNDERMVDDRTSDDEIEVQE